MTLSTGNIESQSVSQSVSQSLTHSLTQSVQVTLQECKEFLVEIIPNADLRDFKEL